MSPQVLYFDIQERLTLSKEGVWLSNGEEITHEGTVRAFFRNLHQDASGSWCIRIGHEQKPVELEDTPAFVRSISGSAESGYRISLVGRDEDQELDPSTLRYIPGRLTCRTSAYGTSKSLEARFLRAPYHELLRDLRQDDGGYFIVLQGRRVTLQPR